MCIAPSQSSLRKNERYFQLTISLEVEVRLKCSYYICVKVKLQSLHCYKENVNRISSPRNTAEGKYPLLLRRLLCV